MLGSETALTMSSLSLLVLLFLFTVSSHACTARPLTTKPITANKCHHFQQEVEKDKDKVKLLETITTPSNLNEKEDVYDDESCSSTSALKRMVLDLPSGASFQTGLPSSLATTKEERRHAETRSLLGPASHQYHAQETGEEEEAIVQMDYAQPHRKPPIHNDKP
ncbi:hypothetical protein PIB30_004852 [Stylosanthes scabra]|uniref:Uncharacterized protein n=1 Tax=Stylosanthes scabra TaxID=79078 RepID=A0ABU6V1Y0_9FABA|nr:hypothetical protein [Stylosanthes scabra]